MLTTGTYEYLTKPVEYHLCIAKKQGSNTDLWGTPQFIVVASKQQYLLKQKNLHLRYSRKTILFFNLKNLRTSFCLLEFYGPQAV